MVCRFVIGIPVYNNPNTVVGVIERCLAESTYPILVIDDGSDIAVERLFKDKHPDSHPRVSFVRHERNEGKGVALQTGFKESLRRGFSHFIAIDADDQHDPKDMPAMVQAALQSPWALIVGDRDMQVEHVPGSSTFGKKFSNFWVRYQTDVGVADSQSGYRIYPLFFLQNMKFFCTKYDFEIEVLTRLIWRNVEIKNVRISVKYFPPEKRVSHFHKIKDNIRIGILNTVLTIAAMMREQTSPFKSSLAFAVGVFVGVTPLYGLHTPIAGLFSFIFRLNFVYMWIGTNISIPPFIPFLVLGSKKIGESILGHHENTALGFFTEWGLGSVVLGLGLGIIAFIAMYMLKTVGRKKADAKGWSGKNKNATGIMIMRLMLKALGLRFAYFFLNFVVFYYYLFARKTRLYFNEYWKVVRPDFNWFQRQRKIYAQLMVFAQTLVDRAVQRESKELVFGYELDDSVQSFVQNVEKSPKGLVAVASHVGGWELAMTFFAGLPSEKKMLAVMHGIPGQYAHQSSQSSKAEVVFFNLSENTILKIKDHLNEGHFVGMMGDRPVSRSLDLRLFFGKLAAFDTTPMRVALASQAEIYFVFAFKTKDMKYKVFTFKADSVSHLPREEQVGNLLTQYVARLEEVINQYPEQWFNFFNFFSDAPKIR
ncbi:DUF2062 domain-containing protein [Bdellovibrio sp. SKB1291214]|uniref:LpxL/LpxP family acyltransferase n=1 Tax=Bdellovibrio sp. SKB1291214 TaxID=1732569 RepID=UPI000B517D5E|nr:DUF2062 domain-containing protein [Bdellovibrio sp. SKB1291214]UYL09599.1 DUF2062 domain-containing protein [Bdellovibrio sp. SKB1291214]